MPEGYAGLPLATRSIDIRLIVVLTQTAYDALVTKDPYTLYLIVGA